MQNMKGFKYGIIYLFLVCIFLFTNSTKVYWVTNLYHLNHIHYFFQQYDYIEVVILSQHITEKM